MSHASTQANVALDGLGQAGEVGDAGADPRAHGRRLASRPLDGRGGEVGREHVVTAQREADGLRADAAGAVEHALRRIAELLPDQRVQQLALPAHRCRPVGVQGVVVRREVVVERARVHQVPSAMSSGRTGTRRNGRPLAALSAETIAAVETTVGGSPTPLAP